METTPEEASPKSLVSCDSANAYTSLAPATEVEGTPRATQTLTRDRSQGTPKSPFVDIVIAEQQPRTRHRTKLETQWDRSGHRPTLGHFLSRSVGTPEGVITTIAFQQGGTAKS